MVARLAADGDLDAAVAVFRVLRSNRTAILCGRTDRHGRASVSWYAYRDGSYLVGVARRARSVAGTFALKLLAAEQPPRPPGATLPRAGVRTAVDPTLDSSDAWSVQMSRGTTYRIALTTPSECLSPALYRPHVYSFVRARPVRSLS